MTTWQLRADPNWTARACLLVLLVTTTTQLLGCGADRESSASGQIQLKYLRTSDSGVLLRLTNDTNHVVALRASWTVSFPILILQADGQVECESVPTEKIEVQFPGFSHGRLRYVDVSQGETVTLVVPTELPSRYRGGYCKLKVMLQDGTSVGPIQFSP